jgi:hypothetical protein
MSLETATYIHQLAPANPSSSDKLAQGDDHIRLIKACLQATFPNIDGAMTLSHTFLNGLAASLVPFGAIQLWYGASVDIPAGYAVCDGATVPKSDGSGNVTVPDLRDRVPVGASATHPQGSTFGALSNTVTSAAGGAHNHTSTIASAGAHTHSGTTSIAGQSGHDCPVGAVGSEELTVHGATSHSHTFTTSSDGDHAHTATISTSSTHTHSVTVDVTQPSIALHYIMKI